MTDIKLEVGKQYKTRGGWRCVVVEDRGGGNFTVWHSKDETTKWHIVCGLYNIFKGINEDIIAEWSEPKTHEAWVALQIFDNKQVACIYQTKISKNGILALKKITITEGEYDE
jgi:hypothetical protein